MRFFFPRVLLTPVMITAGALYVALCFAQIRVVVDRAGGEAAITTGLWTRNVRLTQIERVVVRRSGAEIKIASGDTYGFGPLWKRRWLDRLVWVRSGFEGMDLAIPQAAADARAADPDRAAADDADSLRTISRRKVPGACSVYGVGLVLLAMADAVRPQAGGWLVHSVAVLIRIYCVIAACVAMLIGTGMLRSAWRNRRTARQQG
jgi:hypothetical protein